MTPTPMKLELELVGMSKPTQQASGSRPHLELSGHISFWVAQLCYRGTVIFLA